MPDSRVADVVSALEAVGISPIVMGGHAVRFYGLARNTKDVHLKVDPREWDELANRLSHTNLVAEVANSEGRTWRAGAFRRFRMGSLSDGREKWLEFWKGNHLMAAHDELRSRVECGMYGGREIAFLGLADLIRSKETERDLDWQDVLVLERFMDARMLARLRSGVATAAEALRFVRSVSGFANYQIAGYLIRENSAAALGEADHPVTQAFLIPFAPDASIAKPAMPIEPVVLQNLRKTPEAGSKHLALVEIVRRRYIAFRKELDRRDKEAVHKAAR